MVNVPLPIQRNSNCIKNSTYRLGDFIGKNNEYLKNSICGNILVDYNTLINNVNLLKRILYLRHDESCTKINQINCVDYKSALFLEDYIDDDFKIALVDDYQNRDRSYIDTSLFEKHQFFIPLSYFTWGVNFEDECNVYCLRMRDPNTMYSANGDKKLTREALEKIKEIIASINASNMSELDKCILVSNYLQSKVQYVEDGFISHADKNYKIEAKEDEITREKVGSINSIINENYGLCMAIANTTTLLLNNTTLNVNVRSLYGSNHVWNIVNINGNQYYMDNTWAITRNRNRVNEALKAKEFTDDYLLFGQIFASSTGHHNTICYINGDVEKNDFDKEVIKEHVKKLSKTYSFDNYPEDLRFKSSITKK